MIKDNSLQIQCMSAAELICSTRVSGFQTIKLVFCIYNMPRLYAVILS